MSSRILRADQAACAPIEWASCGPQPAAPAPPPASPAPSSPAPPDWEALAARAREEGRREGEAAARQAAAAHIAALEERLLRSIEAIASLRPRLRQEAERQAVELALAAARRILAREIAIDPAAVAGLLRSAFDQLSLREATAVRCHPASAPSIQEGLARLGAPPSVRVEPDPSLEAGAVIVETARGSLDASVTAQLEEIERGFAALLEPASRP